MLVPGVLPGPGHTPELERQDDSGLHAIVVPPDIDTSETFIWLVNRPWLESAIRWATEPTVIEQEFGAVKQVAPCTAAMRDASVTAYDKVL